MAETELKRERAGSGARINTGSVSLIVIFAVLCLTVFSVLSLSTAISEKKLAERSAEAVRAYYAADLVCSEKTDAVLEALKSGADAAEIASRAAEFGMEVLSSNPAVTVLGCSEPVSESQALRVELTISGDGMRIGSWCVCDTGDWTPDTSLEVWDGEFLF